MARSDHLDVSASHELHTRGLPRRLAYELSAAGLSRAAERLVGRPIETSGGKMLHYTTYLDGDPSRELLTSQIVSQRTERYVEKGIWQSRNVQDPVRGSNVEFCVLTEPDGNPAASLRKVHTSSWEEVEQLASYAKFNQAGALDPLAQQKIRSLAEEHEIVEIAALFNLNDADTSAALYGLTLGDSIIRDEVWLMGIVPEAYVGLRRHFGSWVQTLGRAVPVEDGLAEKTIRIYPALVEPANLPVTMLDDIQKAKAAGDESTVLRREMMLRKVIKQFAFDWDEQFGPEIAERMRKLAA